MTDFRALCAELVEKWDNAAELDDLCDVADVMDRARAALAQPEPQEPTDEELFELSLKTRLIGSIAVAAACHPDKVDPRDACAPAHTATLDFARAVLARWGRPAIEPVPKPEEQVLARVEFAEREFNCPSDVVLRQYCDDWFYGDPERCEVDPVDLCRGAIKLFAQIPAPISVSERLPGPEDCDAEGRSWFGGKRGIWMLMTSKYAMADSFWLPHHALPVPQP